jgi:hypothetical protein
MQPALLLQLLLMLVMSPLLTSSLCRLPQLREQRQVLPLLLVLFRTTAPPPAVLPWPKRAH